MTSRDERVLLATIETPGLATVQDSGRHGWAGVGVPRAGAWHQARFRGATRLAGMEDGAAIELLAGELAVRMYRSATIGTSGPATLLVDGSAAPSGAAIAVHAGSRVALLHRGPGPVYLAIGGWLPTRVLGSASVDTFSGLGGGPLAVGDRIEGHDRGLTAVGCFLLPTAVDSGSLRVIAMSDGPWVDERWRVSATSRSGTRLLGGRALGSGTVPSAAMVAGAVQSTPSGELIILGPDGGITGGYPVLGVVITADLDAVSTLEPGQEVRFRSVTVDHAIEAHETREPLDRLVDPAALGQAGGVGPG